MSAPVTLLDRQVYLYAEVDRLIGLRGGTARRWINGYDRNGKFYDPILREHAEATEWVTWGEFVEARMLAEYRDQNVPTARLRAAVDSLRQIFHVRHPLAYLQPYLAAEAGELLVDTRRVDPASEPGQMVARSHQLLLDARSLLDVPSRRVIDRATLSEDDDGEKFAAELEPDERFPGIVINPERFSGQPTFTGRRVSVETVAGMAGAGEDIADLAADYGLSIVQVRSAVDYAAAHGLAA